MRVLLKFVKPYDIAIEYYYRYLAIEYVIKVIKNLDASPVHTPNLFKYVEKESQQIYSKLTGKQINHQQYIASSYAIVDNEFHRDIHHPKQLCTVLIEVIKIKQENLNNYLQSKENEMLINRKTSVFIDMLQKVIDEFADVESFDIFLNNLIYYFSHV